MKIKVIVAEKRPQNSTAATFGYAVINRKAIGHPQCVVCRKILAVVN